jgi:hypothetical protein
VSPQLLDRRRAASFSTTLRACDEQESAAGSTTAASAPSIRSAAMRRTLRFPASTLAAIQATRHLYIRAGDEHRFIPIWVVVVGDRVLVRSWNDSRQGWYRAFLERKRGAIRVEDRELAVRGVPARSARLTEGVERAYAEKYTTRANQPYVRGFATERRRRATLELRPLQAGASRLCGAL